jgi:ABC-type transporter Mla subunit MlaD
MTDFDRRAALLARVDTLERHAATLAEAFKDAATSTEARSLRDTLRRTRAFLEDAAPGPGLDDVQHVIDSASLLLASLGRSR